MSVFSYWKANLANSSSCPVGAGNGVELTLWVQEGMGIGSSLPKKTTDKIRGERGVVRGRDIANQYSLTTKGGEEEVGKEATHPTGSCAVAVCCNHAFAPDVTSFRGGHSACFLLLLFSS